MLLMDRLFDRLLPWKAMMLVCLLDDGSVNEVWSSGDKMADQGRSLVEPAAHTRQKAYEQRAQTDCPDLDFQDKGNSLVPLRGSEL